MPWVGIVLTIGWNLSRHRRGQSTICGVTREILPPPAFIAAWTALTYVMVRHILDGYE